VSEQRITRPLPEADGRMQPFWDAARRGAFMLQRCKRCNKRRFPAAECCSNCLTSDLEWTRASGVGVVHSFVVIHHAVDPYFASRTPYVVADVKLAEGPHVTSTIVGSAPSEVSIGDRVEVAFEPVSETIHLPVFRRTA
jgi:uncharacterized OB-fold protein